MALDTYEKLRESIADWLDRDDLTDQIPAFIALAESMHKRDIRIRQMMDRASLTVNARQIAVPNGFLEAINLRLLTDPVTVLENVNLYEMNRLRSESTGKPHYFTIHEEIEFDVVPDSSYSGEIVFYKSLTPLSNANASNALLDRAPDAYLYGALLQSAPFLLNDERIPVWTAMYRQAVEGLKSARRQERHVGPIVSRVAGATP